MLFPTIYSTLDPDALGGFVSKKYHLNECVCTLILRGVGDTYLIVSRSSKYILRVYRNSHRSLDHIQAEVDLLHALRDADVSISYPIPDLQGTCIQSMEAAEGTRHAVLFSFASGESIVKLSDTQLRSLGVEMAKFHHVSSGIQLGTPRWVFDINTTLVESMQAARPCFATIPDELTWWLHASETAMSRLASISGNAFHSGYCHYDFLPKNFHFEGDQITLFDFDFFGRGWLINDLMTFWTHLCLDVQFSRMTQIEADRSFEIFLNAYQTLRNVSQEELRAIPSLSIGWWCYYMGFHASHDQFMVFVQPSHLKMRTALIRQLVERNADRKIAGA